MPYQVIDPFEGFSYFGVKDVDSSPNPLGCSQDFVTYWNFYPQGGRRLKSGAPGATGNPYATVTILLDGSTFCSSFPPIEEFALRIGKRIWRVRGDLVAVQNGVRVPASDAGASQALGLPANTLLLPYQALLGGTQTRSSNQFLLPPDFIEALAKAPIQNIPARVYHPEERVSEFQIGAKTVEAWREIIRIYASADRP